MQLGDGRSFTFPLLCFVPLNILFSGQIHHRGITRHDLIQRSELILLVEKAEPFRKQVPVSIGRDKDKTPDFIRIVHRYKVIRILKGASQPKLADVIEVDSAFTQWKLELHKKYYIDRISKSPIFERYIPETPAVEENQPKETLERRVIFLGKGSSGRWEFVVEGAAESEAEYNKHKGN